MSRLIIFSFVYCLTAIFIQGSVLHGNISGMVLPDLVLVFVVFLALRFHNLYALFAAFFLGLVFDAVSAKFLGPYAASFVFAYLLVYLLVGRLFAKREFVFALIVFLATIAKSSFYLLMLFTFKIEQEISLNLAHIIFKEALYSALFSVLVLKVFHAVFPERYQLSKRGI